MSDKTEEQAPVKDDPRADEAAEETKLRHVFLLSTNNVVIGIVKDEGRDTGELILSDAFLVSVNGAAMHYDKSDERREASLPSEQAEDVLSLFLDAIRTHQHGTSDKLFVLRPLSINEGESEEGSAIIGRSAIALKMPIRIYGWDDFCRRHIKKRSNLRKDYPEAHGKELPLLNLIAQARDANDKRTSSPEPEQKPEESDFADCKESL